MDDVCVIGSGWAGFNAALCAAKNNLSVSLIERDMLGGTCLNNGCIPTKILVNSACHLFDIAQAGEFGIETESPKLDFDRIHVRKDDIIARLRQGLEGLIRAKKINLLYGQAKIFDPTHVAVGDKILATRNIVIASGSRPKDLPNLKFGASILSSTDLLNLKSIPKSLLIIGGGIIGCEFASIYSQFGTKVMIVEILERILVGEDKEVSQKMQTVFKKKGVEILTGTDFSGLNLSEFDKVLLCVGRIADIENLGLDEVGVKYERNKICVDENLRTSISNIYAVGDCSSRYQLAHVAAYEASVAIENILGRDKKVDFTSVPNCVFTHPEIASVGLTEAQAKDRRLNVKTCRFNFLGLGMAHIKGATDGFIKIVVDNQNNQILGAVIFGLGATELISTLGLAIRSKLTISQVYDTIFAHPTLSECIHEAAANFYAV